ncbi:Exonuclease RecJ [uncultured Desulfobacterium sp.]|uniref:Single-stranded-DNA-specific exonuclease RecJ n=1 Tax=uncultured Desulfobacterium sp. TaxID=201089 RepID=A0A445MRD2_9BACT|nr:Exonuclease RecJ [uncultured Desulfobacterium sp.]
MTSNKLWKIRPPSNLTTRLAGETGLSPLIAQLLINRGIADKHTATKFIKPRLADMIDPMGLKDMADAMILIIRAIERGEKITVFGDYDADGLTATALLYNFFSAIGIHAAFYIPNRLGEGYGLNIEAVQKIAKAGGGLIITVDCGASNRKEIELAQRLGLEIVISDHHQVPQDFMPCCPVINPNQPGCRFGFKELAGVGVAFFLAVAIRAGLRDRGWFKNRPEPDLKQYLDLVALGTVADRVRLLGQNRMLVAAGMEVMESTRWLGLRAMKDVADVHDAKITAEDLAFRIGPRLNAPGRIGDALMGMEILTTDDPVVAKDLAFKINAANSQRQGLERDIFDQILYLISDGGGIGSRRIIFFGGYAWHKGVLGIVASKLVDKYYRPSLVFNIQNGFAVGSGRSIDGFNMFQALSEFRHLFEKFGGHSHAAGFTLKKENLGILEEGLESLAHEKLTDADLTPAVDIDCEVGLCDVTFDMIRQIRSLAPFGEANPEPCFLARRLQVLDSRVVGERHLKLRVRQGNEERPFDAIGFGFGEKHPLNGKAVDVVFTPEVSRWQGLEGIQLKIVDLRPAL